VFGAETLQTTGNAAVLVYVHVYVHVYVRLAAPGTAGERGRVSPRAHTSGGNSLHDELAGKRQHSSLIGHQLLACALCFVVAILGPRVLTWTCVYKIESPFLTRHPSIRKSWHTCPCVRVHRRLFLHKKARIIMVTFCETHTAVLQILNFL
jgi:hypothetical protein